MKIFVFIVQIVFFSILTCSCELDSDPNEGKITINEVFKDIDTVTYWNRASVYIIKKSDFKVNSTLIIQGGAVIKFDPQLGRSIEITKDGHISAQASLANPIVFTSLYDDSHGRDSNHDQGATQPQVNDWDFIHIGGEATSAFSYCEFYYGGGGAMPHTISFKDSSVAEFTNCTFAYNNGGNIETGMGVLDASNAYGNTRFRYNTFYGNNLPMCINSSISLDGSNMFFNPKDCVQVNKYNAIHVNTRYPISTKVSWIEKEVPFVISGTELIIQANAELLLGNFVVLKFLPNVKMVIEGENISLLNNDGPGVFFTSIKDDSHLGDTNGDGANSHAADGDWQGIIPKDSAAFEWRNVLFSQKK
jgi:hypothetical protein